MQIRKAPNLLPCCQFQYKSGFQFYLPQYKIATRRFCALAIYVPATNGKDMAVLLIQCRKPEKAKRSDLIMRVQRIIQQELLIDCTIELVPRRILPRTTSGKLSRSRARKDYMEIDLRIAMDRPAVLIDSGRA
jgi:hypothetical protein